MISDYLIAIVAWAFIIGAPCVWLWIFISNIIHKRSRFEIVLSGVFLLLVMLFYAILILKYFGL